MAKKIGNEILAAIVAVSFMFIFSFGAMAAPSMPHAFKGVATLNGEPLPSGYTISAKVDSVTKGSVTLTNEGEFGMNWPNESYLLVQNVKDGDEITFHLSGPGISGDPAADETATYSSGAVTEITLTFNAEVSQELPSTGGSETGESGVTSGSGRTGGSVPATENQTGNVIENQTQTETRTGEVFDISLDLVEGQANITLFNKDSVTFEMDGKVYNILLKSISDFGILLESNNQNIVLGNGEEKTIDVDGDGENDISVMLEGLNGLSADLLFKPFTAVAAATQPESDGVTGMLTDRETMTLALVVIVILVLIIIYLAVRRRKK